MDRPRALNDIQIRRLLPDDAAALSAMLRSSTPEYQQYFTPFAFDEVSIARMLAAARSDRYWAVTYGEVLAGFFMLRGFDEGYETPSYGVSINQAYANRGLLRLTLSYAASWCRLNGVGRLVLKVHPLNVIAKRDYERFGFISEGTEPGGQLVYYMDLRR